MRSRTTEVLIVVILVGIVVGVVYYAYRSYMKSHYFADSSDVAQALVQPTEPYTTLDGTPVTMEDFVGKPIVVTSFASWSPESAANLLLLQSLAHSSDKGDIVFVAINRREDPSLAKRYLDTLGPLENVVLILDPADSFYAHIDGYAMPETIVYDRNGTLVEHYRGLLSEQALLERMRQISEN